MSRVAVVDIGTNSTRLLVADVNSHGIAEIERRSTVTRLGEGLEGTGRLGDDPQARVFAVLDEYREAIEAHGCEVKAAVMTSAVRDAANGSSFADRVREEYGLDGRTISGDEEARLTYGGATAARDPADATPLLVIDIGGGSTELVVGSRGEVEFHDSMQVGVVRHTERHLHHDPPTDGELDALRAEVAEAIAASAPTDVRERVQAAVAVAGTATMTAAIDLGLEAYDSSRIEGHHLPVATLAAQLGSLASVPLSERKLVRGLHPDRAPTIVAGVAILLEVLKAFGLDEVEVSDRDILWGVALHAANRG